MRVGTLQDLTALHLQVLIHFNINYEANRQYEIIDFALPYDTRVN